MVPPVCQASRVPASNPPSVTRRRGGKEEVGAADVAGDGYVQDRRQDAKAGAAGHTSYTPLPAR